MRWKMKCSKCNNPINEGQEVCLSCGHILGYESQISKPCTHCNREIPIEYKKCPYCKKKQKYHHRLTSVLVIFLAIGLSSFMLYVLYSPSNTVIETEYKNSCHNYSYEELVRNFNQLEDASVRIVGHVTNVKTTGIINNKIQIELFLEENEHYLIKVNYQNNSNLGIIYGDQIIIYGDYTSLDGNTPFIDARYIEIVEN